MEREPCLMYDLDNNLLLQKLVLNQGNKKNPVGLKFALLLLKFLGCSSDNQANHPSLAHHTGLGKIIGDLISPLVVRGKAESHSHFLFSFQC